MQPETFRSRFQIDTSEIALPLRAEQPAVPLKDLPSLSLESLRRALMAADEEKSGCLRKNDTILIVLAVIPDSHLSIFDVRLVISGIAEDSNHRICWIEALSAIDDYMRRIPRPRTGLLLQANDFIEVCFGGEILFAYYTVMNCLGSAAVVPFQAQVPYPLPLTISRARFQQALLDKNCILTASECRLLMTYVEQDADSNFIILPLVESAEDLRRTGSISLYRNLLNMRTDCVQYSHLLKDPDHMVNVFHRDTPLDKGILFILHCEDQMDYVSSHILN